MVAAGAGGRGKRILFTNIVSVTHDKKKKIVVEICYTKYGHNSTKLYTLKWLRW